MCKLIFIIFLLFAGISVSAEIPESLSSIMYENGQIVIEYGKRETKSPNTYTVTTDAGDGYTYELVFSATDFSNLVKLIQKYSTRGKDKKLATAGILSICRQGKLLLEARDVSTVFTLVYTSGVASLEITPSKFVDTLDLKFPTFTIPVSALAGGGKSY